MFTRVKNSVALAGLVLANCPVVGALAADVDTATEFGAPDPFAAETLLRLFAGLFVVLIFVIALIWMMKRLQQLPSGDNRILRSLGSLPVGQRERVMLVQVGDEQIVIGITANRIDCLHHLTNPVDVGSGKSPDDSFAAKLRSVVNGGGSS